MPGVELSGTSEYEGTTEILWDTQKTVLDGQEAMLICHNGHEWASEVQGK